MPLIHNSVSEYVTRDVYVGFTCDKCGTFYGVADIVESNEVLTIRVSGGYGSVWGDGNNVTVVLCQQCGYDMLHPFATVKYANDDMDHD